MADGKPQIRKEGGLHQHNREKELKRTVKVGTAAYNIVAWGHLIWGQAAEKPQ